MPALEHATTRTTDALNRFPAHVPRHLEYAACPAWGLLDAAARDFPERVACRYFDQAITWSGLRLESARVAQMLRDLGLASGERVGVLLPNVPEFLSVLNGTWMAGGVAVAISPLMVAEEVSDLLASTDCRIVVCLDLLAPLVLNGTHPPETLLVTTLHDRLPRLQELGYFLERRRRTGHWIVRETEQIRWLSTEVAQREPLAELWTGNAAETPAYILPTGGTTAAPKAVVLSHRNLVANAHQQAAWAGRPRGEETMMAVLPFFHSYGLSAVVLTGTAMAAELILSHRYQTKTALALMQAHRPTIFHAVPAMLNAMNERLRKRPHDLSSLRWVISGGASLPVESAEEFTLHSGATVVEGYGLSEASPVVCVGPLDGTSRHGTIGLPLSDTEARIVDVETGTADVPEGHVGELIVRGPQVMLGYWKDDEATARTIRDGWLFTGDLAVRDGDGLYRIVDRKKDLIITSGFNVYPGDVEVVLRRCPAIADVAVIGVPDARRGEAVKAIVVLRDGVKATAETLEAFCQEHLAHHKRPRHFEIVTELPKNFLGKVLRRRLREASEEAVESGSREAPSLTIGARTEST